jgi:hypothetical protein
MSNYAYIRALRMGLINEDEFRREEFLREIHTLLGVGSTDCDKITSIMSDEEFIQLIEQLRRRLKRRKIEAIM